MSVRAITAAWEVDLPASEKLMLICLADHADPEGGNIYPSIARISRMTGLSRRTVQRTLRDFERRGLLELEQVRDKKRMTNTYRLKIIGGVTMTQGGVTMTQGGVTMTRGGRHHDAGGASP